MKLLFDANISYRIVRKLQTIFAGSLHVSRTGLTSPASDRAIWEFARKNGFTMVTFDEDFYELVNLYGAPPKIIWLRFDVQITPVIVAKLTHHQAEIQALLTVFLHKPCFLSFRKESFVPFILLVRRNRQRKRFLTE